MGTGEDLTTAGAISEIGIALRFRLGVLVTDVDGVENNIQTLSATPPKRPSKQRRRSSSCPKRIIRSLDGLLLRSVRPSCLVGDADFARIRSMSACRRAVVGVAGGRPLCATGVEGSSESELRDGVVARGVLAAELLDEEGV